MFVFKIAIQCHQKLRNIFQFELIQLCCHKANKQYFQKHVFHWELHIPTPCPPLLESRIMTLRENVNPRKPTMKKLISVIIASVKLTSFSQNMVSFFLTGSCNAVLPNCLLQCQTFYCRFYHILFFRIPATYRRIESQHEKHRNLRWNIGSASAGIQASASILF